MSQAIFPAAPTSLPRQDARRFAGLLLPHPPVDTFAQQISVPTVAGVLIDPVNPKLPDSDPVPAQPRAQIRVPGQHRISCRLLASKVSKCALDQRLLGSRSLKGGLTRPV
jgi:hypothetical protein